MKTTEQLQREQQVICNKQKLIKHRKFLNFQEVIELKRKHRSEYEQQVEMNLRSKARELLLRDYTISQIADKIRVNRDIIISWLLKDK